MQMSACMVLACWQTQILFLTMHIHHSFTSEQCNGCLHTLWSVAFTVLWICEHRGRGKGLWGLKKRKKAVNLVSPSCLPALPFRAECLLLLPVSADGNADMVSLDFNCKVKALPGSPLNQYIFDMMVLIKSHEKRVIRKIETLAPAEHLSCSVWEHLLLQAESKKCLYQCRLTKCRDLHASVYFNFAEEMCQLLKKTLKDVENRRLYHN